MLSLFNELLKHALSLEKQNAKEINSAINIEVSQKIRLRGETFKYLVDTQM